MSDELQITMIYAPEDEGAIREFIGQKDGEINGQAGKQIIEHIKELATPKFEPKIAIDGADYPIASLGLPEIGELRLWAKKQQPNPIEELKPLVADLPIEVQKALFLEAAAQIKQPIMYGSAAFMSAIQTGEGFREMIRLSLLRAGAQGLTTAMIAKAADSLGIDKAADVIAFIMGQEV